jgi:glucosamine 6-phosphate synthetase-like amidotransferase/phosphosugar isomerase protein
LDIQYIGILLGAHPILHINRIRVKQAEVFSKSILYMLKGVEGEVPKTDKFSRRAVSFVMCFLEKAERREREREREREERQ